jgi:hypothetical protein
MAPPPPGHVANRRNEPRLEGVKTIEKSQSRQNQRNRIGASFPLRSNTKPREISEIITPLAFYAGSANATLAIPVVKDVFAARKLGT